MNRHMDRLFYRESLCGQQGRFMFFKLAVQKCISESLFSWYCLPWFILHQEVNTMWARGTPKASGQQHEMFFTRMEVLCSSISLVTLLCVVKVQNIKGKRSFLLLKREANASEHDGSDSNTISHPTVPVCQARGNETQHSYHIDITHDINTA